MVCSIGLLLFLESHQIATKYLADGFLKTPKKQIRLLKNFG